MNFLFLFALFVYTAAMPHRGALPRLPISVMAMGKYKLIPEDKIVGGVVVPPNWAPFQISLQRKSGNVFSHSCGGSILDANVILDAAHCVRGVNVASMRIVAGEHSLSQVSGLEQIRNVVSYTIHADYNTQTFENDISLIFLDSPLDLSVPSAQPVYLPRPTSEYDPPAGTLVTVTGWGSTFSGGSVSDLLRRVYLPIVSDATCNAAYGGTDTNLQVFPSMLCAGDFDNGGIDSCQGDSGGPLFTALGDYFVQHGIVSWGQGCALSAYPGVYTQVSYFLDWISSNRA